MRGLPRNAQDAGSLVRAAGIENGRTALELTSVNAKFANAWQPIPMPVVRSGETWEKLRVECKAAFYAYEAAAHVLAQRLEAHREATEAELDAEIKARERLDEVRRKIYELLS
jgi:hypothetical protein